MAHVFLLLLGALVVAALAYGVTWVITGRDSGLDPEEPDGRAVPLPTNRPLFEADIQSVRFDTVLRGYRMDQVDAAMRRAAYDVGYKDELISVLEAEVAALRENRTDEAEVLRAAREGSGGPKSGVGLRPEVSAADVPDAADAPGSLNSANSSDIDVVDATGDDDADSDAPTPAASGR